MQNKFKAASLRTPNRSSPSFKNSDVYVQVSHFLRDIGIRGYGLYASRDYAIGDVIQEYTGKLVSLEECKKKRTHRNYFFEVRGKRKNVTHVIDGANTSYSGPARYVNSIRYEEEQALQNTKFVQQDKKIYLMAIRPIRRNEELISYYGKHTEAIIQMS